MLWSTRAAFALDVIGEKNNHVHELKSCRISNSDAAQASVADPDPGFGTFLTPGSGIRDGRESASGSGIREEQPGS